MKLDAVKFGLAIAVVWSASILVLTIISSLTDFGYITLTNLSIYPGYDISIGGAFIGAIWAFVDGFIGGWLVAALYNRFIK